MSIQQMSIQQRTSVEKIALDELSSIKAAKRFNELSDDQKENYKISINIYQIKEKQIERSVYKMRIVNTTLKTSTRTYISSNEMNSSIRSIIKLLAARYKRSDDQIIKQIHEKFQIIQQSSTKNKIEI